MMGVGVVVGFGVGGGGGGGGVGGDTYSAKQSKLTNVSSQILTMSSMSVSRRTIYHCACIMIMA